jgi:hypothetical protein
MFVRFGGGSFKSVEIKSGITPQQVLTELTSIAKDAWSLMNLCGMLQIFRLATNTPLFNSIKIDPLESIFGNNGWRQIPFHQAATWNTHTVTPQHVESDDVPSSAYHHFESDDVPSSAY